MVGAGGGVPAAVGEGSVDAVAAALGADADVGELVCVAGLRGAGATGGSPTGCKGGKPTGGEGGNSTKLGVADSSGGV